VVKVMLVDDEPIEREGICFLLQKHRSNFEVVGEAGTGKEAVEGALLWKPDLVFMDIKMPEFDGIEAISQIVPILPETKFIMVSAFDTFDYAREAMKFGIKEYLLKPSKVKDLLEAYDRMAEEIEAENQRIAETEQMNRRLGRAHSFVERDFIVSLIMDHVSEFTEGEWEELLGLQFADKRGFAVVFSFESDALHPTREEKSRWYKILKQVLQEEYPACFVGPLTGFQVPVLVLFSAQGGNEEELRQKFVRKVIHSVQIELEKSRVYAGVGSVVTDVHQFFDSYNDAIYALELVHDHQSAAYSVSTERLKKKRKELVPFEIERELIEAVKKGDTAKGLRVFETYFQSVEHAAYFQVNLVQKAMEDFFIVLSRALNELGVDPDIQGSLGKLASTMQLKEATKAQLIHITDHVGEWRENGMGALLLQAKKYVDTNYHKPVSLEEVAETIGISYYYLSKLFHDQFAITFMEYLKTTRIQQAIKLMLGGNMALKEVALSVGYKDPNYFSTAFKKETGMSPREYRSKYQR